MKLVLSLLVALFSQSTWATPSGLVYRPQNFKSVQAKLLVVIHGCLQSAESMAFGTGFSALAAQNNWVLYFPQVDPGTHPLDCWSWYKPENQKPSQGQLRRLVDEIQEIKRELRMGAAPTYLAGISSGGLTVSGLLACFPENFKAGAIHSGGSYGLAGNLKEAEDVLRDGPTPRQAQFCQPQAFRGRLLVIQGTEDKVLNPRHAERLMTDFLPQARSLPPRADKAHGLDFKVTDYLENNQVRGRLVMVEGLGHAWSGSGDNQRHGAFLEKMGQASQIPFFSPQGPNATQMMWNFFTAK